MITFQIGETVVFKMVVVKDGAEYDPTTSMKLVIYDPDGDEALASTSMVKASTGNYAYSWQTTSKAAGRYRVRYTATDGTNITIKDGLFKLGT